MNGWIVGGESGYYAGTNGAPRIEKDRARARVFRTQQLAAGVLRILLIRNRWLRLSVQRLSCDKIRNSA